MHWRKASNHTFTTSTSSSEVLHDSSTTQRVDTYVTQIIGRIEGGPTLFDQSYSFAYGSGQVAAGVGDAQAALTSYFGFESVQPRRADAAAARRKASSAR